MRSTSSSRASSIFIAAGLFAIAFAAARPGFAELPKSPPNTGKLFAAFESQTIEPYVPSTTPQAAAQGLDQIILTAAAEKKLSPTDLIDDEAFLRRASVDLIGRIPTAGERHKFLSDSAPNKRTTLIRYLLKTERFVERLTIFFDDILRVRATQDAGASLHGFIAQSIRENLPYDKMVHKMITAKGPLGEQAVGFLVAENADPLAMPGVIAQEFLGIRMSCAQCHDHPFDTWSQKQYYDIAAFFGKTTYFYREKPLRIRVGMASESSVMWPPKPEKDNPPKRVTPSWPVQMLDPKDAHASMLTKLRAKHLERPAEQKASEEMDELIAAPVSPSNRGMVSGMETDSATAAKMAAGDADREGLAELITSPRNRFFAWHLVNRMWAELVGTPIVDPVDDFRSDNAPSNPRLLNRLADEFVASGYNLRFLTEMIMSTQAYQRQTMAGDAAARKASEKAFVAAPLRRLSAEAIYDSLVTAGHLEEFKHPEGTNMTEVTYTVTERRLKAKAESKIAATTAPAPPPDPETLVVAMGGGSSYSSENIDKRFTDVFMELDRKAARESEMVAMMASDENVEYVTRKITEIRDENPKFSRASEMPAPVPSDHMLRSFGQPPRATLGESRDRRPNMRQSLILLNGRLVNQAARVGAFEPMGALMDNDKPVESAIELAYIEALTRKPTPTELTSAIALIKASPNRRDGIADLRWVLLNSLEFRYLK